MTDRQKLPPGLIPRLLTADQAAAYCQVSRDVFDARIGIPPMRVFGRRLLYDRLALDRWLDHQSGLAQEETEPGRVDWAKELKAEPC